MTDHITAIISLLRHGEKDAQGALTETGHQQAKRKGLALPHLRGDVILCHSGVGRVRDTIRSLASRLHLDAETAEELLDDAFQLQDYEVPYLHYLFNSSDKGEYFGNWSNKTVNPDPIARMQYFLSLKDTSLEPEVFPSPRKMAQRVTTVLLTQIQFAALTKEDNRTNFINGTHEPVLMAFLAYVLSDFQDPSDTFLEDIGGSVGYTEGCDVIVTQSGTELTGITLHFRGREIPLTVSALQQFIAS